MRYNQVIPLLSIYPRETYVHREIYTQMFITALFVTTINWEQPDAYQWVKKETNPGAAMQ